MNVLYMILFGVAGLLLLLDAFSDSTSGHGRRNLVVKLLPLALFFWVLVPFIQFARLVF